MQRAIILAIFVTTVLFARQASACKCAPPPPPKKALEEAAAVFSGKVVKIEVDGRIKKVTFNVQQTWKGVDAKSLMVTTPKDSAACGVSFEKGKNYLVYCLRGDGELSTHHCSRTTTLEDAADDLKELGDGKQK